MRKEGKEQKYIIEELRTMRNGVVDFDDHHREDAMGTLKSKRLERGSAAELRRPDIAKSAQIEACDFLFLSGSNN